MNLLEPGSTNVRSIFRVHMLSDLVDRLVRDPRLLDLARTILGSDVYVHQSRANLKPGFRGKEFYWHSDFETWHVEDGMPAMRAISCSVLLTDNDDTNGPLMLMPGSQKYFISCVGETPDNHYKESLKKQEYGVPDDDSLRFLAKQCGIKTIKARAGSVVFLTAIPCMGRTVIFHLLIEEICSLSTTALKIRSKNPSMACHLVRSTLQLVNHSKRSEH